jgi:hypothetical protein
MTQDIQRTKAIFLMDLDNHSTVDEAGTAIVRAMQTPVEPHVHHLQGNLGHAIQDRADNIRQEDTAVEGKDLRKSHHTGDTIYPQVVLHWQ